MALIAFRWNSKRRTYYVPLYIKIPSDGLSRVETNEIRQIPRIKLLHKRITEISCQPHYNQPLLSDVAGSEIQHSWSFFIGLCDMLKTN